MWAADVLAAQPQAKSLPTHLRANNHFLRYYCKEYYLKEDQRFNWIVKLVRLLFALCIYLVVTAHVVAQQDWIRISRHCTRFVSAGTIEQCPSLLMVQDLSRDFAVETVVSVFFASADDLVFDTRAD